MSLRSVFFHGFLGLQQDWQKVISQLTLKNEPICLDLNRYHFSQLNPMIAGEAIAEEINTQFAGEDLLLVGYSMGGRLLLETRPHLKAKNVRCILVSTNLQPLSDEEREKRLSADEAWAEKFLSAPFSEVLSQWNAQEVFQGSVAEPVRFASDYDRQVLANQMVYWSLANQFDLLQKAQRAKALYIAGAKDLRYQRFISQWGPNSGLEIKNAPQAGHRVLFDEPDFLSQIIQRFF